MAKIPEVLLSVLEELVTEDLKKFKWHLTNSVEGDKCIPKSQLKKLDTHDTVDKMVQKYGTSGAVELTVDILKKINYNKLAEDLRSRAQKINQQQDEEMRRKRGRGAQEQMSDLSVAEDESTSQENQNPKVKQLFNMLNLEEKYKNKIKTSDILQLTGVSDDPCAKKDQTYVFLKRLLLIDYRARNITTEEADQAVLRKGDKVCDAFDDFLGFLGKDSEKESHKHPIHPMDVQMAVLHCSDSFLKQLIVTKLSQCQYALPLLVPDPFTREIEFPLWTFRQIKKSWKTMDTSGKKTTLTKPVYSAETPMVAFFRLGSVSSSKSQLMNSLINEKHNTFFHRHCPGSSRTRLLMDGVVEIAWYLPSGKSTDHFPDCVVFCNLHGCAESSQKQLDLLTEMATINVVFISDQSTGKETLSKLFWIPKPLISLLSENDCSVSATPNGKYKIGLKDRNQSDVLNELRRTIKECLRTSKPSFKLEDVSKFKTVTTDEYQSECQRGKEAAIQIKKLLEGDELYKLKEKYLPHQGKLWHEWCQKNKELHRPRGNNLEMYITEKKGEMTKIRKKQVECGQSHLIRIFSKMLNSGENLYFLKWLENILNQLTLNDLSKLHRKYEEKWHIVLKHKKNTDQQIHELKELKEISEKMSSASFGLEHILREMGQEFESYQDLKKEKLNTSQSDTLVYPRLAANLILAGFPLELMDGDASHVPLVWVSAVLDELIKILGDQRVFVLSVLGIQSSGKSTMLNAMFGLQFAVSAGRCTRGAFMQLVKVSEEMKAELKFDYILVVDTEGLRSLELEGFSTRHHDNELATFVVGLGSLTLINIFGENPSEMQDILQIVVQAFLRMKKVRLNPSCMFVHQNVGDISAGEQNIEGRRRLLGKLDEMTKLAAKEEGSQSECFSDVIKFDVQEDVKYFAHLWEGSPPMAPPNPSYCENVQEIKNTIIRRAKESNLTVSSLTLTQLKDRIKDLWQALLSENFVFSFRNTLEIALYRKLEEEYGKWTWSLRSKMLNIQDKLHTNINNRQLYRIEYRDLVKEMKETLTKVQESMKTYFEENQEGSEILQQWKASFDKKVHSLHEEIVLQAKRELDEIIRQKDACRKLEEEKSQYERKLFEKSKEFALTLKNKDNSETELKSQFDSVWGTWISDLTAKIMPLKEINIENDIFLILSEIYEGQLVNNQKFTEYGEISMAADYTKYVIFLEKKGLLSNVKNVFWSTTLLPEDQNSIKQLVDTVVNKTKDLVKSKSVAKMGYSSSYIQEIARDVKKHLEKFKSQKKYNKEKKAPTFELNKDFSVDLSLYVCDIAQMEFAEQHQKFREGNDPVIYLEKMKPEFYSVFKKYCHGATSAVVLGGLICSKLGESILQSVYNRTASDLAGEMRSVHPAFNGNRSNLEKHILKALAEMENFADFKIYLLNPQQHFENFIKVEVQKYITKDNPRAMEKIAEIIASKQQCVITAANTATRVVTEDKGNANMWLEIFSEGLKDELEYNTDHLSVDECQDISDFQLLTDVVKKEICVITEDLNTKINRMSDLKMENFRKRPDEILIEHFCRCCWVQCPFCRAICTNTMEDHDGDHSVPFHRVDGICGMYYRNTTNLSADFCTTVVQSNKVFYPNESDWSVPYKQYRTAGGKYAVWSITPDNSELSYWKWFVCRFQKDLEGYYEKTFEGSGQIPDQWRKYTKKDAIESLDKYFKM